MTHPTILLYSAWRHDVRTHLRRAVWGAGLEMVNYAHFLQSLHRSKWLSFILVSIVFLCMIGVSHVHARTTLSATLIPYSEIQNDKILLRDIMENIPNELQNHVVGPAPSPGKSFVIPVKYLKKLMRHLRYSWQHDGLYKSITVKRAAQLIAPNDMTDFLQNILKQRNMLDDDKQVQIKIIRPTDSIALPIGIDLDDVPLHDVVYDPNKSRFTATLSLSHLDRSSRDIRVQANITPLEQMVVAVRNLRRGHIITPSDVRLDWIIPKRGNLITIDIPESAIGMETTQSVKKNTAIYENSIQEPVLVKRRDSVLITYNINSLSLTAKGIALDSGRKGDTIRIENKQSGRKIEAKIIATGVVSVSPAANALQNPEILNIPPQQRTQIPQNVQNQAQNNRSPLYNQTAQSLDKYTSGIHQENDIFDGQPIPFSQFNQPAGQL